jgi:predicted DNA-binding transcriptional regulator AlpA
MRQEQRAVMARYLRYQDLNPLKGITFSRQHIRRLQKALKFPLSVSFGDNTEVFIDEEIDRWTADRIAERDAKAAALAAQHALLESRPLVGPALRASQKIHKGAPARARPLPPPP